MTYDKFALIYRNRKLIRLEKNHDPTSNIELMKTEAIFREYLIDPEINSTDDIAAFYTIGVGQELVKKTANQKPSRQLRRVGHHRWQHLSHSHEKHISDTVRSKKPDIIDLLLNPPKEKQ